MSSTTAIELANVSEITAPASRHNASRQERKGQSIRNSDEDAVIQASLAADADVPDGGYGWVIVASGAVLLWWALGTTYAWGVMQTELVEQKLSTPAVLSFIGSLDAALIAALALVNSRIMKRLGARMTAVLGVVLMGGSEILSGFATKNLGALFFTSGILMGLGVRLVRNSCPMN